MWAKRSANKKRSGIGCCRAREYGRAEKPLKRGLINKPLTPNSSSVGELST